MRRRARLLAAFATLALALGPAIAEARPGGGFSSGSRGSRTYSAPPSTRTAPGTATPFNRSEAPRQAPGTTAPGYAQPRPVYVHCRSGQNRTGVMVAAYRIIEEGMPVEAAIEEMGRYNGFWFQQDAEYLRSMAAERMAQVKALADRKLPGLRRAARFECGEQGCVLK